MYPTLDCISWEVENRVLSKMTIIAMAVEVVKRLAKKQIWMRRRITGGRRRRGRTGSGGGLILFGRL